MPLFNPAPTAAIGNPTATTSGPTTTSATYVVIPEMTTTITTQGGSVILQFAGTFDTQNADDFTVGLFQDGVLVAGTEQRSSFTGASGVLGLSPGSITAGIVAAVGVVVKPAAGSHTYDARWKRAAGTARAVGILRTLEATELF